jgi:isopenicillin-N N-acyltransferase-like protein
MKTFPYFEIEGDNVHIGEGVGSLLAERIAESYRFYEDLFAEISKIDPGSSLARAQLVARVREYAEEIALTITKHFPTYATEIEAVAAGAGIEPWKVYTLNGRTEIYRLLAEKAKPKDPGECTAVYFPTSGLLGQNWDWHPHLEDLAVILKLRQPDGHTILMFTEPGIIGKMGLNSAGLGVCLNILFGRSSTAGVPIHILLRAVLDARSVSEAAALIAGLPLGTSSNILLGDAVGNGVNLEIQGSALHRYDVTSGDLVHTNHYIADESSATATIPGSVKRLERARALFGVESRRGVEGMKAMLADCESTEFPICRSYSKGIDFLVGTVASVIFDLKARALYVARGQGAVVGEWAKISLADS